MNRIAYFVLFFLFALLLLLKASAQNSGTYSPYSRYGVGERALTGYCHSLGMGGISQGVRMPNAINALNPASYTRQDTMSFIFELGVSGNYYIARSASGDLFKAPTSTVDHIALQVPLQKWGGLALGFQPYSRVGYDVYRYEQDPELISRLGAVRYNHRGSGGLNEAYLGIAVEPFDLVSIGLNGRYIFGAINRQQDLYVPSNALYSNVYTYTRTVFRGFILSPGVQLHFDYGEEVKRSVVLGGTVDFTPPIRTEIRQDMRQELLGREIKIVDNRLSLERSTTFPLRFALGGFYRDEHWSFGADFAMQNWKGSDFFYNGDEGGSEMLFAAGASWTPNAADLRTYAKRVEYKVGIRYNQLPVFLDGQRIRDVSLSFGTTLPFRFALSRVHLSAYVGRRGQMGGRLVEEWYLRLHLGVSLNDVWFLKYKYN